MSFVIQQLTEPLDQNLLWSRPERKNLAGKLLIIGGNLHDFMKTQQSFTASQPSGAGEVKVALPKALRKLTGDQPDIEFCASTSAGSFSHDALGELKSYIQWADGVLFSGEFSSNSETEQLLVDLFKETTRPTYMREEATHVFLRNFESLPSEHVTVELSDDIIRQHIRTLGLTKALTSTSTAADVKEIVEMVATTIKTNVIFAWQGFVLIHDGHSGTQTFANGDINMTTLSTQMTVLQMQFPTKPLSALSTGAYINLVG